MAELTTATPPSVAGATTPLAKPPANPFFRPELYKEEAEAAQPGIARERLTLDEGPVILTWPANLSHESVADLQGWLNVVIGRAKRKAGIGDQADSEVGATG